MIKYHDYKNTNKFLPNQNKNTWKFPQKLKFGKSYLNLNFKRNKQYRGITKDGEKERYLNATDIKTNYHFNHKDNIQVTQGVEYLLNEEDPDTETVTQNLHPQDNITLKYNTDITLGTSQFKESIHKSSSEKINDYIDKVNRTLTKTEASSYKFDYRFTFSNFR